eukprot:TRINITY_DN2020_c0_g1_i8.p1 TRINITY_DN2020_c0_g1~~TRINITY_DN2020_c0_g1_i8.p1  ORF type:complete len:229 (-),score=78.27 TRINITY_DN2020_c0_g1_i8:52-738(-)
MNKVKLIQSVNEKEIELGLAGESGSWHDSSKSAYIYVGGLDPLLTEGDVLCVFSQYGDPVDIDMPKDHEARCSKGFAFLCYKDRRSTILAIDNLNGFNLIGRTLRVDHADYKPRLKEDKEEKKKREEDEKRRNREERGSRTPERNRDSKRSIEKSQESSNRSERRSRSPVNIRRERSPDRRRYSPDRREKENHRRERSPDRRREYSPERRKRERSPEERDRRRSPRRR